MALASRPSSQPGVASGRLTSAALSTRPRFADVANFVGAAHVRANPSKAAAKARPLRRSASAAAAPAAAQSAAAADDAPAEEGNWWDKISPFPDDDEAVPSPVPARGSSAGDNRKRRVKASRSSPTLELPEPVLASVILPPSDDPPEEQLAVLRMQMIGRMGSAREAFQVMDTNSSGNISFNEFERTFPKMLGLTESMPGYYQAVRRIWRLFDLDHKGGLDFEKVFPGEMWEKPEEPERMSTPEFWDYWVRKSKGFPKPRGAGWNPSNTDEKIAQLFGMQDVQRENTERSKRMRGMIKRLKTKGKSDARVREIVCRHLPRGTGPPDMQDIPTFSTAELQQCKNKYTTEVHEPTRNIQKEVFSLRDTRRVLSTSRQELGNVVDDPFKRAKALAANKEGPANPFNSLGDAFRKKAGDGAPADNFSDFSRQQSGQPDKKEEISLKQIAEKYDMDVDDLENLYRSFLNLATDDMMGKGPFLKFMRKLCTQATLVDADLEAWFLQACQKPSPLAGCWLADGTPSLERLSTKKGTGEDKAGAWVPPPAPSKCNFEQWVAWYGGSDARVLREGLKGNKGLRSA